MAESKKPSSGKKTAHQTRAEAAEALRQAAELIASLNSEAQAETTKKPAAKKPAAKKPAAKSGTAKKPTTKKPAEPKKTFGNRRSDCKNCGAENDKYALVCHVCGAQLPPLPEGMVPPPQSVAEEKPAVEQPPVVEEKPVEPIVEEQPVAEEQPVVEEQPVEEKPAEPVVEEKPEKPVEEKPAEPVEEKPAEPVEEKPAEKPAKKSGSFWDKASNFINNKGKLPLWIVANVLLFMSSILLLFGAFSIPSRYGEAQTGNMFTYLSNAAAIKAHWQGTAGTWAGGGYAMLAILMVLSFLGPLALIAKNIVLLVLKKNKDVHMFDAIITFTFFVAYLGVVGMFGANITWAHVLALVISIILLAYTIFVILLQNRDGMFPFFSIANLVWILLCVFLLTNTAIYNAPRFYAAFTASLSGSASFAFIMLLVSLAALALLIVMQVKKLPTKIAWLFEFLVPAVAGVFAFIALIDFAAIKPDGISMGAGFVCGAVFVLLLAIADVVFALVPALHKYNVKVADKVVEKPEPEVELDEQPAEQPTEPQPVVQEQPAAPVEQPADNGEKVKCPSCGMENGANDMFCMKCGRKLK